MDIYIKTLTGKTLKIQAAPSDSIENLKEKIQDEEGIPPMEQSIIFAFSSKNSKQLEDKSKLADYGIKKDTTLYMIHKLNSGILQEDSKLKENREEFFKNFDKLLPKNDLFVNMIYYNSQMANDENYIYYNLFKNDVIGEFFAIDNLEVFKKYLEKIKNKKIPFIIITTGSNGKEILPLCKKSSVIKEVIIFCRNYKYNEHYIKEYPKLVKKVFTALPQIYDYIKQNYKTNLAKEEVLFQYDVDKKRQILPCPVITAKEYDKRYFVLHKAYSHFFGDMDYEGDYPEFNENNIGKIVDYLNSLSYLKNDKNITIFNLLLKNIFSFYNLNNYEPFVEQAIKYYTDEGLFYHIFNTLIRDFKKDLERFSHFMGPFLFRLNKYVKYNSDFSFSKDMQLSKLFECSEFDFYFYKLNLGHIICFPSLVLTSSKALDLEPDLDDLENNKDKNNIFCELRFNYIHEKGNISPGIVIEDNKGHDLPLSKNENEVILFPFTFAKIKSIELTQVRDQYIQVINLDIINRKSYIEYDLRDDVNKRTLISDIGKK